MIQIPETLSAAARVVTAAAVAALLATSGLSAQDDAAPGPAPGTISFDLGGGVGIAAGQFEEIVDGGGSAGGGVSYHVSRVLALRGGADVQFFEKGTDDAGVTFSDVRVIHFGGGIEINFLPAERRANAANPWTGNIAVGAGASNIRADEFTAGGLTLEFDQTYFSAHGMAKLGYQATPTVNVFLEPKVYLVAADETETAVFNQISEAVSPPPAGADPLNVQPFDTAWMLPIHLGVRISLR